ncbi:DUF2634 domain-containing protein [Clostridium sp. DJ247]|uniref:DUF2634 domain-containing protein n=1 Tax=Clostridium sp. DJ247 TaxID=2726188 RepID=UPI00162970CF|nr:DUF2634 domain-containing protein [Clostridium sp. DJ247]MBC2579687.1 DUF2634 domain-containing protein [Clostridium sp. DJ247]
MSIVPQINLDINAVISQGIKGVTGKVPGEYAWDFEKNEFLLKDGKFVIVQGKEALKIWVWKALHTTRIKYSIYSLKYGNDLESMVGKGYSRELLETEAKRLIWECLSLNSHITGVENFSISFKNDILNISFTAITDQGKIFMNNVSTGA